MRPRFQKSYTCLGRNKINKTVCRIFTCTNVTYICTVFIQITYLLTNFICNILTITPPATIYNFHPSLISTTLDTCLSIIMIDTMMMAF
jgi:hypothetical protein